jgi:hypothetical protein
MNPIFSGKIDRGKVLLDNPNKYLVQIGKLEGQRIEVVLRKQKTSRSNNQNSYYWGVVLELLTCTGYTAEEMHEIMKYKFLQTIKIIPDKKGMPYIKSTTKLNTIEMEEYLEKIRRFASMELNCFIPLPNEVEAA